MSAAALNRGVRGVVRNWGVRGVVRNWGVRGVVLSASKAAGYQTHQRSSMFFYCPIVGWGGSCMLSPWATVDCDQPRHSWDATAAPPNWSAGDQTHQTHIKMSSSGVKPWAEDEWGDNLLELIRQVWFGFWFLRIINLSLDPSLCVP